MKKSYYHYYYFVAELFCQPDDNRVQNMLLQSIISNKKIIEL